MNGQVESPPFAPGLEAYSRCRWYHAANAAPQCASSHTSTLWLRFPGAKCARG